MVLSSKEKQQRFRAKHADKFRALNMLLPNEVFDLLTDNAKAAGITKVAYLTKLLQSNQPHSNYKVTNSHAAPNFKIPSPSKVKKVKAEALPLAKGFIDTPTPSKDNTYDGTTKIGDAIAKVVGCSAGSNNTISNHTKRAKNALELSGTVTKEADKIAIVEWLSKNPK